MKKIWLNTMGQISGFGGSYEDGCRAMVLAGFEWLNEHPNANPIFKGYNNVYGIIDETNEDAKALTKACMDAKVIMNGKEVRCGDEATGAMHQAAIMHCLFYKANGWDKYVEQMSKPKKDTTQ